VGGLRKAKRTKRLGVSYLRVSGRGQVGGDGFPRQREAVESFAKRSGIDLVEEYRDEAVKGASELADRAGLAGLLDRVESNGVRVVVVENATRLARDLMTQEIIAGQFREIGVTIFDASGNDLSDDSDPTRTLVRQVLGAMAQFDKSIIVLKLRAARDRIRAREGRCEGRKPFGFFEGEAEAISRMRQLRRKPRGKGKRRMSFAEIAATLNAEAVSTRTGKPWHWQVVRRIIQRGEID